jgi:hypothetical protein
MDYIPSNIVDKQSGTLIPDTKIFYSQSTASSKVLETVDKSINQDTQSKKDKKKIYLKEYLKEQKLTTNDRLLKIILILEAMEEDNNKNTTDIITKLDTLKLNKPTIKIMLEGKYFMWNVDNFQANLQGIIDDKLKYLYSKCTKEEQTQYNTFNNFEKVIMLLNL